MIDVSPGVEYYAIPDADVALVYENAEVSIRSLRDSAGQGARTIEIN